MANRPLVMTKRHLAILELEQLAEEYLKHNKPRMAGIVCQITHLIDRETTLNNVQMTEVLHLLDAESERQKSISGVVSRMTSLINGLYQTHLLIFHLR